jgi:hypothetical protein
LNNFVKQTVGCNGDGKALGYVRNGIIVLIVSMIVGVCGSFLIDYNQGLSAYQKSQILHLSIEILAAGGYTLMLLGYLRLKNSETFHPKANVGAQKLVIAQILLLVTTTIRIIAVVLTLNVLSSSDESSYSVWATENGYMYYLNTASLLIGIIGCSLVIWGWAIINNATSLVGNEQNNATLLVGNEQNNATSLVGNEQNNGATDVPQTAKKRNWVGIIGFGLAVVGFIMIAGKILLDASGVADVAGVAFAVLFFVFCGGGLLLSIIGLFFKPRKFAVAGLITVLATVLLYVALVAALGFL